ncbi:MAG: molybdenum ABC transporter ATP-binding protein [Steroidobacterales bacterium]
MLSVSVRKRRGAFALDTDFELPTPGVVALFGRSGCGKSTLVDVLAGLLDADSGRIALDDTVLLDTAAGINVAAERRGIGYVFQDARLFPHLRVAANLRYGSRRAIRKPYVDFETVTGLLGLEPLLGRRCHQLSGGERQRVAIGRALLSQPRLLLLDEPLAALDSARRDEVLPYLEVLRDQLTIPMVYVSHDFDEVMRLATHLVLIDSGRTLAQGDAARMSLRSELREIIGPEAVRTIVDGEISRLDAASGLAGVTVGAGELKIRADNHPVGAKLRVQILARDVIVATREPHDLSVRNVLRGVVTSIVRDTGDADLISIDVGGTTIMARITAAATRDLALATGMTAWALVKSVSMRGRLFKSGA